MGLEFPTNILISSKSSSKIFLTEIEDKVSKSVFSSETILVFEIVQAAGVLVKVPLVQSEIIFSTMSRVLA